MFFHRLSIHAYGVGHSFEAIKTLRWDMEVIGPSAHPLMIGAQPRRSWTRTDA